MVDLGLISLVELGVFAVGLAIMVFEIRNMSQTRKTAIVLWVFDKVTVAEFWENWRQAVHEQKFESVEEWGEK